MREEIEKKKQESVKKAIIQVAKEIVEKDGFDGLSIRKIANKVGYSPGNIYQYFKNKDHIIEDMISDTYLSMLEILKKNYKKFETISDEIVFKYRKYIDFALDNSVYFKMIMINENEDILKKTSVLKEGSSIKQPALFFLRRYIEKGIEKKEFCVENIELTTQSLWVSVYGLIMRLIVEKNVDKEYRNKLIDYHLNLLINSIKGCE
ncbi:MAG: TetR/AcrR family transcriptional regulator [Thermotogota bacterium]